MKKKNVKVKPLKPIKTENAVLNKFSARLKSLRKEKGFNNQEYFAYENDFSRVQVGKWERGGDIKLSSLARVCDALGISLKEFFNEGFD